MGNKQIGIITFWDTQDNYGQILQCYALQKYLRNQGQNAFLIKTVSDTLASPNKLKRIQKLLLNFFSFNYWSLLYFRFKGWRYLKKHGNIDRQFNKFRDDYIVSTDDIYTINDLNKKCPEADIYITGSDQVWGAVSNLYFLNFVPTDKKKYSYAASFGHNPLKEKDRQQMKTLLSSFNEITVRETKGITICENIGLKAKRAIDPTGLLNTSDYYEIAKLPSGSEKFILVYLLGNYTDVSIDEIYKFAQQHNFKVKYIASQARLDKYEKINPSPSEWLGLIAKAEYIFTNSYHCCMFSIYFEKKFIAYQLKGIFSKMNVRIDTLYNEYGIPLINDINKISNTYFDYKKITDLVLKDRKDAQYILKKWIL